MPAEWDHGFCVFLLVWVFMCSAPLPHADCWTFACHPRRTSKHLRKLDLKDLKDKRAVLGRTAYKARVIRVLTSTESREVAAKCMRHLKKVCAAVSKAGGAATSVA